MSKLCEVIAVVKDRKAQGQKSLTDACKQAQKSAEFEGRFREYTPSIDGGQDLPTESSPARITVQNLIDHIRHPIVRQLDTIRTQDSGNTQANADLILESDELGDFSLIGVPATHLLYLEKFFMDLLTFANAIPSLDSAIEWKSDQGSSLYRSSNPIKKMRTSKEPKVIVKCEATQHHPAQTELIYIDEIVGTWKETRFSGAMPAQEKEIIVNRIAALRDAARQARERANSTFIDSVREGKEILDYIFG